KRTDSGCGNAVLACSGFGNDTAFAHPHGEQSLADTVVDLVRAGMEQVFPFEIDLCAAKLFAQTTGRKQRCLPACIFFQQAFKLGAKLFAATSFLVLTLQLFEGGHQCFWNIASAVSAKTSRRVFLFSNCARSHNCSALRTAATNAFNFSGSLRPGSRSTPVT